MNDPASRSVPSAEQLDIWITQNRRSERRERWTRLAIALAFAISVGAATSNVLVLNKLDERGAKDRDLIVRIDKGVENTQRILDFTDQMTSPEQRAIDDARTAALLDELTKRVDCNTRKALLEAISDVFGPDTAADYDEKFGSACPPPPSGSTTTVPGG